MSPARLRNRHRDVFQIWRQDTRDYLHRYACAAGASGGSALHGSMSRGGQPRGLNGCDSGTEPLPAAKPHSAYPSRFLVVWAPTVSEPGSVYSHRYLPKFRQMELILCIHRESSFYSASTRKRGAARWENGTAVWTAVIDAFAAFDCHPKSGFGSLYRWRPCS